MRTLRIAEIANEFQDDDFLSYAGKVAVEAPVASGPDFEALPLVQLFIEFEDFVQELNPSEWEEQRIREATEEARDHLSGLVEPGDNDHWLGFFKHALTEGHRLRQRKVGLSPGSFSCVLERYVETYRPYPKQV